MIDRIVVSFDYVLLNMRQKKMPKIFFKHNFIVNFSIIKKIKYCWIKKKKLIKNFSTLHILIKYW